MRKQLVLLAALAALASSPLQAQSGYLGLGAPGLVGSGFAYPWSDSIGLRSDFAGGLSVNRDGSPDGMNMTGAFKASRVGTFADWFPLGGAFRLVGGLSFNDTRADVTAQGLGNGSSTNAVTLSGDSYNLRLKLPDTTAYLGIGYGHQKGVAKGLGFYADVGLTLGNFGAEGSNGLPGNFRTSQAEVDAFTLRLRDALGGLSALPSASMGLTYRY